MSTQSQKHAYSGITPEELHIAIQRAHAERAKAIRELFSALLAWRHKVAKPHQAANPALNAAACR